MLADIMYSKTNVYKVHLICYFVKKNLLQYLFLACVCQCGLSNSRDYCKWMSLSQNENAILYHTGWCEILNTVPVPMLPVYSK